MKTVFDYALALLAIFTILLIGIFISPFVYAYGRFKQRKDKI